MTQVHIPHDAVVEDNVTMANSAHLGGHTHIGQGATLGLGALVHQGSRIGRLAMIGMGSVITKDIPPFAMAFGSPARVRGVNRVGMQRAGYPDEVIDALAAVYAEGVPTAPDQVPAVLSAEFARFFAAAASSER
jgi:UDP-N-acetylglucosamine acyltransferase